MKKFCLSIVIISMFLIYPCLSLAKDKVYKFCASNPNKGKYIVKVTFKYDFGKEAARQLALKKIKPFMGHPIQISDFKESDCGTCDYLDVVAVNIDGKIAESLLNDPASTPGVIVEVIHATVHDVTQAVKNPQKASKKVYNEVIKKPVKKIEKVFKKIF